MKIQILFFEGCPNHHPATELVREVTTALNIDVTIEEVEIQGPEDSVRRRFLGSPSILVDGVDVEPASRSRTDFGYSCRTYNGRGLPPRDMVAAAILGQDYAPGEEQAQDDEKYSSETSRPSRWFMGGSIIAAAVASACCWLPLLLITFGLSAGGLGTLFEQTRPIFLTAAVLLLSTGFYFAYIRKEQCEPGSACETTNPKRKRVNRMVFWVGTVGVLAFAAFPSYVSIFQPSPARAVTDLATTAQNTVLTLTVEGMSCEGCTAIAQNELAKVAGVFHAEVQFEQGRALVTVDSASPPSTATLIGAIEKAGYKGQAIEP